MAAFGKITRKAIFGHGSTISDGAVVAIVVLVGAGHWGLMSAMKLRAMAGSTYYWIEM